MRVLQGAYWGYGEDPVLFFNFEKHDGKGADYALAIGYINFKCLPQTGPVVIMCFEEPNGFASREMFLCHKHLDVVQKVFTLCPYTADWSNARFPGNKWEATFYPFNTELLPAPVEKDLDIVYAGHRCHAVEPMVAMMGRRKIAFASHHAGPHVTHLEITYKEKLSLFARAKIALVHNQLFPTPGDVGYFRTQEDLRSHEGFKEVFDTSHPFPTTPQLKSRLFEAAFCKSLILCRRDNWKMAERFFDPDKEFVYYDDENFEETVEKVLSDYDSYIPIVEAAHKRAMENYTTDHYWEKHLKGLVL